MSGIWLMPKRRNSKTGDGRKSAGRPEAPSSTSRHSPACTAVSAATPGIADANASAAEVTRSCSAAGTSSSS